MDTSEPASLEGGPDSAGHPDESQPKGSGNCNQEEGWVPPAVDQNMWSTGKYRNPRGSLESDDDGDEEAWVRKPASGRGRGTGRGRGGGRGVKSSIVESDIPSVTADQEPVDIDQKTDTASQGSYAEESNRGRGKKRKRLVCYNCWSDTHGLKQCPHPLFCSKCGGTGHTAQVCSITKGGSAPLGKCYNCGSPEHSVKKCPHPLFCTFCNRPGHTSNVCWLEDPKRKVDHNNKRWENRPKEDCIPIPKKQILAASLPVDEQEESGAADDTMSVDGHNKSRRCFNCGSEDHAANKCPKPLFCTICNQKGHTANRCKKCHNCGGFHLLANCPHPIRCTKCGGAGHTANRCKKSKAGTASRGKYYAAIRGLPSSTPDEDVHTILSQRGVFVLPTQLQCRRTSDIIVCIIVSDELGERDAVVQQINEQLPAGDPPLVAEIVDDQDVDAVLALGVEDSGKKRPLEEDGPQAEAEDVEYAPPAKRQRTELYVIISGLPSSMLDEEARLTLSERGLFFLPTQLQFRRAGPALLCLLSFQDMEERDEMIEQVNDEDPPGDPPLKAEIVDNEDVAAVLALESGPGQPSLYVEDTTTCRPSDHHERAEEGNRIGNKGDGEGTMEVEGAQEGFRVSEGQDGGGGDKERAEERVDERKEGENSEAKS